LADLVMTLAALSVMAFLLWPRPTGCKAKATRITCTNNLKQIGLAYRQWAIDHGDKFPTEVPITNGGAMEAVLAGDVAMVFRVMSNELDTPKILFCPTDKRRIQATAFATVVTKEDRRSVPFLSNSNISYFVGLAVSPSTPEMFLAGDDNWLIGGQAGYYGGVNGSPVKAGRLSLWTNSPVAWADSRHGKQGNLGLADGSVQGFSSNKLAEGLRHTEVATNQFVFP